MINIVSKKAVSQIVGGVTCVNSQGKTQVFVTREFCPSGWSQKNGGTGGGSAGRVSGGGSRK